jgi:hypothetical protein
MSESTNFQERPSNIGCYISVVKFLSCSVILKWLIPWSRVPLEKVTFPQIVNKFFAFYEIRSLISVFTKARHWPQSWARSILSTLSHPIALRSILILTSPSTFVSSELSLTFRLPFRFLDFQCPLWGVRLEYWRCHFSKVECQLLAEW